MNAMVNHYVEQFRQRQELFPGIRTPPLRQVRQKAMEHFVQAGFPVQRMEDWKYTPLTSLLKQGFKLADQTCQGLDPADLDGLLLDRRASHRLVFVNGFLSPPLSDLRGLPAGVGVESLARMAEEAPERLAVHMQPMAANDHGFVHLHHAMWCDGVLIHLAQGIHLEQPLQLLFLTTPGQEPRFTLPWNILMLEQGASAQVVESHVTLGEAPHFTNGSTTILLGEGARLGHLLLLAESQLAHHVAVLRCSQMAGSHFNSQVFAVGNRMSRQEIHVHLAGEEAQCVLDGLFVASDRQQMDFHTWIHHASSHTQGEQLYKGILDGQARGVFNGVVRVPHGVAHTQSRQLTANLLLSDTAEIDTKPQLEIHSDAVQCSHGATVGSLDEESLFYLQSRGMDRAAARQLLIHAFADQVVARVESPMVRHWLERQLKLEGDRP